MGPPSRGADPGGFAATRGGTPQPSGDASGATTPAWASSGPGPGWVASAGEGTGSGLAAEGGEPKRQRRGHRGGLPETSLKASHGRTANLGRTAIYSPPPDKTATGRAEPRPWREAKRLKIGRVNLKPWRKSAIPGILVRPRLEIANLGPRRHLHYASLARSTSQVSAPGFNKGTYPSCR